MRLRRLFWKNCFFQLTWAAMTFALSRVLENGGKLALHCFVVCVRSLSTMRYRDNRLHICGPFFVWVDFHRRCGRDGLASRVVFYDDLHVRN